MRENIMLSTSTSNSSFLNGNGGYDVDDRMTLTLDCETRENYREPMSKIRKIAFIASISSCILVVIVFLLLPCSKNCVAKHHVTKFTKTINWIKKYEKLELKGSINTVGLTKDNSPLNLIFMYRNDKIFPDPEKVRKGKQRSNGGIMKINGQTGDIEWQNEMTNEPAYTDCSLIDCDNNGVNDCLVLDSFFQLACIDETGHWIYYNSNLKATKQRNRDLLDFPLILPDLNNDNVKEIMMGSTNGKNSTNLVLLSGSNGKILAEETQNCSNIHKLQIDSDYVIKFICVVKENVEQQVFKNLSDFYSLMAKRPPKKLQSVSSIEQHKYFGRRASINAQTVITNVHDKELVIENKEMWPRSKMTLKLTGKKNGEIINYYSFSGNKIYAFTPVAFSFNVTITKSRIDNIHGFVVKFWIWNGTEISYNLERNRPKRDLKAQRSNYTNQNQNQTYATYKTKIRFLKESILLLAFNSTNMKAENVSQSNIVQFCQKTIGERNSDTDDSICQPDLSYQENSILIDNDSNGSKELVSYYSTFYDENQGENVVNDQWKLKTYIQLFKLELLSKLYGSDYDIF